MSSAINLWNDDSVVTVAPRRENTIKLAIHPSWLPGPDGGGTITYAPALQSWAPEAGINQRVIHAYTVDGATHQMTCVYCKKNIIHTAYGEGAIPVGERTLRAGEVSCGTVLLDGGDK